MTRKDDSRRQKLGNAVRPLIELLEDRFLLSFSVGERVVTVGDTACRASASTSGTLYATIPASKYGTVQQRGADNGGFEWYRVDWDNYSYPLTDGWSAGGSPRFVSATVTPSISSVSPNPVTGSSSNQNFTVNGSSFVSGAIVRLKDLTNGGTFDKTPTSFSATQLVISANFTTAQANWSAQVINPGNVGSNVVNFTVNAPTVTPSISSVSPNPVTGSSSNQNFTVNGSSFVSGAIVRLKDLTNGGTFDKTPTNFSSTQLVISANFTTAQANWSAQVINPGNAGSNVVNFTVNAPTVTPSITSVSPNPVTGSNSAQNFTVNGSSFVSGAIVRLKDLTNGGTFDKTPTSFASNQLVISAVFTTAQATWSAQIINPGNAGSNVVNFTVNAPTVTPSISSVSPNPVTGSASAQNFTVNGSNFVSGAIVRLWDVTNSDGPYDKTPTSFSGSQLVISAIFTVNQANWTAQVINPGNAGSNVFNFTVNAPVATPTITSVSPNPVTGSSSRQPFHIYGTNFNTSSVIKLRDLTTAEAPFVFQNGDGRFQYHDSTHLEVDPNFTTAAHQWSAEVINTGNASSGQFNFNVVAPAAAPSSISGVSPNPITADPNNNYQTLTINGSNFVNKPTVVLTWTGQSGYTLPSSQVTFVNSTRLQMSIKLGASADNWTVKVTNPDGQASSPASFQAVVGTTVDLRGLDLYAPTSAKWGQAISVSPVDIKNYGTGAAGPFKVQWYLSRDSVGSVDDLLLPLSSGATSYSIAGLGAGANTGNFSVALQLPTSLPSGWSGSSFYVVMKTDSADQVTESNESNNFGQVGREYDWDSITITTNTQYANLLPQALSLSPNSGLAGSDVQVSFKVVNSGPVASFATTANVRLSTSSTDPSPSDPLLGTVNINALAGNGGQQTFSPTYKIPAGTSAGPKYVWIIVEPTVMPNANQGSGNGGDDLISAVYTVNVPTISFHLAFPLAGQTAYTAVINSVFDHAMTTPYQPKDGVIQAYTGEIARSSYGSDPTFPSGYRQNTQGTAFQVNGHYSGGSYLYYDGHPGYDFRAADNTSLYADAGGVVRYPTSFPGISNGTLYHVLAIDHENGYITYYLHLTSHPSANNAVIAEGQRVSAGDLIGYSGHAGPAGTPPHLHYEVQYNGVPVDPYGWQGAGADPYTRAASHNLWEASVVTPSVSGINPTQPVATGSPQLVTIYGSNFDPNASVTLRDYGDNGHAYTNRTIIPRAEDGTSITIKPDFGTTAARWSVEVLNPGNASSGEYSFNVLAPSDTHTYNTATVVGRKIFYNNSAWDGDSGASSNDDLAIASDKAALLPGGTATFANYTSYSKGINGIIVDIADLPGQPTANDFVFRVGNDSTLTNWTAPSLPPASVTVRRGAGVNGSDRITIIWADNAIAKTWLQVTVRATSETGLARPDVFYFGNAVGDSGNSTANANVDSSDQLVVRSHLTSAADVTNTWDYNRDKKVDLNDLTVARNNGAVGTSSLQLLTLSGTSVGVFAPFRGSITWAAEGGNGNVTLSIHWPNTANSGVTIGAGYDMGERTYSQSYADLVAAGVPVAQAQQIANGAGLKGEDAHQFVLANRDLIGPITPAQRQSLFDNIYPTYVSIAIDRYEFHRTHDTADGGTGLPLSEPLGVPFEQLHWAIQDMVVDFVYQGFGAKLVGYYRPMRAAMNDSFDELISYIANTPAINQYEPGRQRIPFLEQYRNSPHDWPSSGTLVANQTMTGVAARSLVAKSGAVNAVSQNQKVSLFSVKRLVLDDSAGDILA